MATESELSALKRNWKADPCWDIWQTEGFEDHEEELRLFQTLTETQWKRDYREMIIQKAIKLHCSFELAEYIDGLEKRIEKLGEK
jgi:hypothetical protein